MHERLRRYCKRMPHVVGWICLSRRKTARRPPLPLLTLAPTELVALIGIFSLGTDITGELQPGTSVQNMGCKPCGSRAHHLLASLRVTDLGAVLEGTA